MPGVEGLQRGRGGAARISRREKRCEPSWSEQLRGRLDGGRLWASLRPAGRELGGEGLGSEPRGQEMLGRRMPQGYLAPPPAILGTTLLGHQPGDPTWGQRQGKDRDRGRAGLKCKRHLHKEN